MTTGPEKIDPRKYDSYGIRWKKYIPPNYKQVPKDLGESKEIPENLQELVDKGGFADPPDTLNIALEFLENTKKNFARRKKPRKSS